MKIFWSIIAVLAILTAGLLIANRDRGARTESGDQLPRRVFEAGPEAKAPVSPDPSPELASPTPPELKVTPEEIASPPQPGGGVGEQNPDRVRALPTETRPHSEPPAEASSSGGDAAALTPNAPAEITIVEPRLGSRPSDSDRDALVNELTVTPSEANETQIAPSTFEERDDGSTLVDGRFLVRGQGTREDPYEVPWEMLAAPWERSDPPRDKVELPERVKLLDGKYVRVIGYVAFPIDAHGPDEMLAMRHPWDGCCVGVPPTPYDALQVRLREEATAQQVISRWGRVTGRFKVEPHFASSRPLGPYLMDDATLQPEGM